MQPNQAGQQPAFKPLPMASCFESPTNPRKHWDDKKFTELVNSVKATGVLEPVIARPVKQKFEIIAGSRRFRASQKAGCTEIPAMVRDYTDLQVREIQLIENAIREDMHPMEEAASFKELLAFDGYTAQVISDKIGHPLDYVTKRLQLTKLIEPIRKAFTDDEINIGHAALLARLPEHHQDYALEELVFEKLGQKFVKGKGWIEQKGKHAVRVAELDALIRENIMLDLHSAPWPKDDATLDPKAGPCTTCPKRTGANAVLFDDLKKGDMCLDRDCFQQKRTLFLVRIQTEAEAKGKPLVKITTDYNSEKDASILGRQSYEEVKKTKCSYTQSALIVEGDHVGTTIDICTVPNCKKHRGKYGTASSSSAKKPDFWEVRAQKLKGRIDHASRVAIVKACADSVAKADWKIPVEQLRCLTLSMMDNNAGDDLATALAIPKTKGNSYGSHSEIEKAVKSADIKALPRLLMGISLSEYTKEYYHRMDDRLTATAKACKVNAAAIRAKLSAEMSKEFKERRAKAEARKKAAGDKAPKKKAKGGKAK